MMGIKVALALHLLLGVEGVPYDLQGAIILKTLPYVLNFEKKEEIVIGFMGEEKKELVSLFKDKKAGEKPVKTVVVKKIEEIKGIDVLVLLPGVKDGNVDKIIKKTRENKIFSITMIKPESFVKKGISMGIIVEGGKPRIIINPEGIKEEELSLDARFLKLVKLIE